MENQEIDVMIAKNQIAFDFDAIETEESFEESVVLPKELVNAKSYDWIAEEVLFVVVNAKENPFSSVNLCGKKMIDWVLLAGSGCERKVIEESEDILQSLKSIKTDKKYIAVFYSDTPLIEKPLFHRIMDYFTKNGLNALTLQRGYVFRKDFLDIIESYNTPCVNKFDDIAFTAIKSARAISQASKILYEKIKNYHIKNGVVIFGEDTVFIDCDVEIETGAVIYPNNILKGSSYLGKNVILESGNIICDSIISDGCVLSASYVEKSKIEKGQKVGPYEKIVNVNLG